jgi:hypothetical protein
MDTSSKAQMLDLANSLHEKNRIIKHRGLLLQCAYVFLVKSNDVSAVKLAGEIRDDLNNIGLMETHHG